MTYKRPTFWDKHRAHIGWVSLYIVCSLLAYAIFYWRFPNNYRSPNFFAEDGLVFTKTVLQHGFWKAVATTFNGYYIWGIYLLIQVGRGINAIFLGGHFINLPRAYALVSYAFWAFTATLPIILLRKYLRWPYLVALVALICFVPMPGTDYGIIGTLGNTKFVVVYVAFLLCLYRLRLEANSPKTFIADSALLICGYTNVTVYLMLPILIIPYWRLIKSNWRRPIRLLRNNTGLVSLVSLAVLLVPQLIVVKVYGIPKLPGYLDGPFDPKRTIEILFYRPYLYAVSYRYIKHFTDAWVIVSLIALIAITIYLRNKLLSPGIWLGIYTTLMTTVLFVINRPGISGSFFGYRASGPDQFFFTQNLIFYVVLVMLLAILISRQRSKLIKLSLFVIPTAFVLSQYAYAGSYGWDDFMHITEGTIYAQARQACATQPSATVSVRIYPTDNQVYGGIPRQSVCNAELKHYQSDQIDLGIRPYHNMFLGVGNSPDDQFRQTFVSPNAQLDGINLYVATFNTATIITPYKLELYDSSCKVLIRKVSIAQRSLHDNDYAAIYFAPIADSGDKTYCFDIKPESNNIVTPIAIRLGEPRSYPSGVTTVGSMPSDSPVVFKLLYSERVQ